jgi:hypothetical protein
MSALSVTAGVTPAEIPAQTFNVKNYGAQGNGVADDRNAIQAAITAMKANGGGTLVFPLGEYRISRPVRIENTSRFIVNGGGSILKPFSNVSPASADGDVIQIANCSQYTVSNLGIDGNKRGRGYGFPAVSMRIDGANDFRIADCNFADSTLDDLYLAQVVGTHNGSYDGVVENCIMDGARRAGVSVIFAHNVEITNNHITNVTGHHPAAGIIFEANLSDPEGAIHDVLVNSNTFENIGGVGVNIVQRRSPKRLTIDGNSFTDCPTGVLVRGQDCVITNNYFQNASKPASGEGSDATGQISVSNWVGTTVTIKGNTITDITGMSAIYIHPTFQGETWIENNTVMRINGMVCGIAAWTANAHVTGNRVDRVSYIGIGVTGDNGDIGSNYLTNGTHAAIYYSGSGGSIWRNHIVNYGMVGAGCSILATGGANGCRIDTNVIRAPSGWTAIKADPNDIIVGNFSLPLPPGW